MLEYQVSHINDTTSLISSYNGWLEATIWGFVPRNFFKYDIFSSFQLRFPGTSSNMGHIFFHMAKQNISSRQWSSAWCVRRNTTSSPVTMCQIKGLGCYKPNLHPGTTTTQSFISTLSQTQDCLERPQQINNNNNKCNKKNKLFRI